MASKEQQTSLNMNTFNSNIGNQNGQYSKSLNRDRSFNKQQGQGRDYNKPRSFNASPTSTRGSRTRPVRELYRPPGGFGLEGGEGHDGGTHPHPSSLHRTNSYLNPTAQVFAPISPATLTTSRSVDWGHHHNMEDRLADYGQQHDNIYLGNARKTVQSPRSSQPARPTPILMKSQSMATTTELTRVDISGLGTFPSEVEVTLQKSMDDPNRLSGRALMDLVRTIFDRVVEGHGTAEPAARLCISIIEREKKETFLESLLNSCQEWYHDRDCLLRSSPGRWTSFMAFLNEMYGLLKRRQLHLLTKYEGVPPKLVLLSLLAECCMDTLTSGLTPSTEAEVECLFLVLTHIGRDLILETPGQMSLLLTCLRDSFLHTMAGPNVKKILLQLIELQAADWQLPAQAVMYYYPGTTS